MDRTALLLALSALAAAAAPPGTPMSEFGPQQVAVGLFFDHSGQDVYEAAAPSVFNTTGLAVEYAPWPYLQVGVFAGADEFDIALAESQKGDTSQHAFNSGYGFMGGGTLKLASPRFAAHMLRLVAYGTGTYFNNEDDAGNGRKGYLAAGGASLQAAVWRGLNLVLGGEFAAIVEGEQSDAKGTKGLIFGLTGPEPVDYLRGLVGLEYFFSGKNRPFISIAFRPTGNIGWSDEVGLRNASICVSLGAITTLPGKGSKEAGDEDRPLLDE